MAPTIAQIVAKNIVSRNLVVSRISEVFDIANLFEVDNSQLTGFLVRYETLATLYSQFEEYHLLIMQNVPEEALAEQEVVRKNVDNMFFDIQTIRRRVVSLDDVPRSPTPASSERSQPKITKTLNSRI